MKKLFPYQLPNNILMCIKIWAKQMMLSVNKYKCKEIIDFILKSTLVVYTTLGERVIVVVPLLLWSSRRCMLSSYSVSSLDLLYHLSV